MLAEEEVDLVVSDVHMPIFSGLDSLGALRASGIDVLVILVTGYATERVRAEAERLGAVLFHKPLELDRLLAVVRELLSR